MPRLRTIEAWPATRHPHKPWNDDPDRAALLGASRGVFDLYRDELPAAEQTAGASSIRFFLEEGYHSEGFRVLPHERFYGGWDMVHVAVPAQFAVLPADEQIAAALEVIHAAVLALAPLRGWDTARLEDVRRRVEARGLRYTWDSPWKTSPGRRYQARICCWLDADGNGHLQVEIRNYKDQVLVARSDPEDAFMTAEGFRRSAKTLRWGSADTVSLIPFCGLFGTSTGWGTFSASDGIVPLVVLPPVTATSPVIVNTAVQSDEEILRGIERPWLDVSRGYTLGAGAYGSEITRVAELLSRDESFTAWWAEVPFQCLLLQLATPDRGEVKRAPRAGSRKRGDDLVLQMVTLLEDLPSRKEPEPRRDRARADLHQALVEMAEKRELPAPPPLPDRIFVNRKEASKRP